MRWFVIVPTTLVLEPEGTSKS